MDLVHFYEGTKRLSEWFGKRLNQEQQDLMFDKLKHIPNESYHEIVDYYIDSYKATQSNFPHPADIKNQYGEWRKQHPEKVAAEPRTDCPQCKGKGFLWATKFVPNGESKVRFVTYEYLFRCDACKNWKRQLPDSTTVPISNRATLGKSYDRVWPDLSKYSLITRQKTSVPQMVEKAGKDVSDYERTAKEKYHESTVQERAKRMEELHAQIDEIVKRDQAVMEDELKKYA